MELLHKAYDGDANIVDFIRRNIQTFKDVPLPVEGDDELRQAYMTDMTDGANLINAAYILGTDNVRAQMMRAFQLKEEVIAYVQAQRRWIEQTRNRKLDFCEAAHTGALDRLKRQPEIYDWDISREPETSEKWYASWVMIAIQVAKNDSVRYHLQSAFAYMFTSQPIDVMIVRPPKVHSKESTKALTKVTLLQSLQEKVRNVYTTSHTYTGVETSPQAAMAAGKQAKNKHKKR